MSVEVKDKIITVESAKAIHDSLLNKITNHENNTGNPHNVTPSQIGADVSGAAAQALVNAKAYTDERINAYKVEVDDALSEGSENPVQNKVVSAAVTQLSEDVAANNAAVTQLSEDVAANNAAVTQLSEDVAANNAAAHNAIFRGKNLTDVYTVDEICQRIQAGTFDDLYIGDYFDITIGTSYTSSEVVRCVLAGFNTYYNNGDTAFVQNHAVIVPKNCFTATAAMNSSNVTTGGYLGSAMWKTVLPVYSAAIKNVLGSHLLTHRTLQTNAVSTSGASMAGAGLTGYASGWEWVDTTLSLLSEIQVYGSTVLSSSLYDTGCDNLQLPLFALNPVAKVCGLGGTGDGGRQWYWLKAVAGSADFCYVGGHGLASSSGASDSRGVRPRFLIG